MVPPSVPECSKPGAGGGQGRAVGAARTRSPVGEARPTAGVAPTVAASRSVTLTAAGGTGHLGAPGPQASRSSQSRRGGRRGTGRCRRRGLQGVLPGGPTGCIQAGRRPASDSVAPVVVRLVKVVRPWLRLRALHLDQPRWSRLSAAAGTGAGERSAPGWERLAEGRPSSRSMADTNRHFEGRGTVRNGTGEPVGWGRSRAAAAPRSTVTGST